MSKSIRWGLIGIGDIAKKAYLPTLSRRSNIELYLCTRDKTNLKQAAEQYHIPKTHCSTDFGEFCKQFELDALSIHTATESHPQLVKQALDLQIPTLVDKPLAYDYSESRALFEQASKQKTPLMLGFNRRFAPLYENLNQLNPTAHTVQLTKHRALTKAVSAIELVYDDAIHLIDTLCFLSKDWSIDFNQHSRLRYKNQSTCFGIDLMAQNNSGLYKASLNHDAGFTHETLEYHQVGQTHIVNNLSELIIESNNKKQIMPSNDWAPTTAKRGFEQMIDYFIKLIENPSLVDTVIQKDNHTHAIADILLKQFKEPNLK